MQSKNGFWITALPLTSLNEQELLGLCAHLIWSSAVIASKVIFRLGGYLEGGGNKAVNIRRAVYQNRWTNLCVKHWRWPFCLSIRVAYFYLLLWALLLLNYSWDFFFPNNEAERKPYTSSLCSWNLDDTWGSECVFVHTVCICTFIREIERGIKSWCDTGVRTCRKLAEGVLKILMLVVFELGSCNPSLSHTIETSLGWALTSQLILAGFPSQVYTATVPFILGVSRK